MTWAQWLAQYHAIVQRREEVAKTSSTQLRVSLKLLRDMLIWLYGLDTSMSTVAEDAEADYDQDGFRRAPEITPLAWMTGHPEVLKHLLDQIKEKALAAEVKSGADAPFEEFSEQLHRQVTSGESDLQGDMIPLLTGDLKDLLKDHDPWHSGAMREQLTALNIKPRPKTAPPAAAIASRPKSLPPLRVLDEDYLRMAGELPFSPEEKEQMVKALQEARDQQHGERAQPGKPQRPFIPAAMRRAATPLGPDDKGEGADTSKDSIPSFGRGRIRDEADAKVPSFGALPPPDEGKDE